MKRREFLKTSLTATTLAGVSTASLNVSAAESGRANREYYELRAYRLKAGSKTELLDSYLEKAAIPTWNKLGIKPVGVFTEREPKEAPSVYVLIPYPSVESFARAALALNADEGYQQAGAEYLQVPKEKAAFERIDSWLMLAFAGLPRLELPAYCRERKPRMFEIRTYESYSEVKAFKKVEMFNSGEIDTMREVGLGPIFYGQAQVGANLPHLTYMLSAEDQDAHKKHWDAFGKHPVWNKLKNDPQYADTVSKITNYFVRPTRYSQI
jgi:NIPSNAP